MRVAVIRKDINFYRLSGRHIIHDVISSNRFNAARRRSRASTIVDSNGCRVTHVAINIRHRISDRCRGASKSSFRRKGDFAGGGINRPSTLPRYRQDKGRLVVGIQQFDATFIYGAAALRVAVVRQHVYFSCLANCCIVYGVVNRNRFNTGRCRSRIGDGDGCRLADVTVCIGNGVFNRGWITCKAGDRRKGNPARRGIHFPFAFPWDFQRLDADTKAIYQTNTPRSDGVIAIRIGVVRKNVYRHGSASCTAGGVIVGNRR